MEEITQGVDDLNLLDVVSKVNLIGSNLKSWRIDNSASSHIRSDKRLFISFKPIKNEKILFRENLRESNLKDDLWKDRDIEQCLVYAKTSQKPCV